MAAAGAKKVDGQAFEPERKASQAEVDAANKRHGTVMPGAAREVMFTELGWAVCRGNWIVKLFDSAADAHAWMKGPER